MEEKVQKIKVILYCLIILSLTSMKSNKPPAEYLEYVKEIVDSFVDEMEEKYGLHCYGSGGEMPHNVKSIKVLFTKTQTLDVSEARKLEVTALQSLLKKVNDHEKIQPFLEVSPFTLEQVRVSISFRTKSGDRPFGGAVAFVCTGKGKIYYDAAEMVYQSPTPVIDARNPKNVIRRFIKGYWDDTLVSLHEETYEEALKIVGSQDTSN